MRWNCRVEAAKPRAAARPATHLKSQLSQGLCRGSPKRAEAKHRDDPLFRKGWGDRIPDLSRVHNVGIHPQVVPHHMAHNPFDHPARQAGVHHPGERLEMALYR